jgi:hypothetical protein
MAMLVLLTPIALFAASGCSSDKDCVELCEEGQAGDCTSIEGSCSTFCSALDAVQDDAGCSGSRESYEECLNAEADVCDASCGSAESSLTQCVGSYCLNNLDSNDCQSLVAAGG